MKVRIKTWKEMANQYDERDASITSNGESFVDIMEAQLPVDRIIDVEDGRWGGWRGSWHVCDWMIAEYLDSATPAETRKQHPVYSGVLQYFPDAIMEVANCSWVGNEQHNKGTPLHWDRSKSGDEKDALVRHLLESGTLDSDGVRHSAKVAWRALAMLQKEIEDAK